MKHITIRAATILLLTLIITNVNAQYQKVVIDKTIANSKKLDIIPIKSSILTQELSYDIFYDETAPKWNRRLINFEKKHKRSSEAQAIIDEKTNQKLQNLKDYNPNEDQNREVQDNPTVGTNFVGNWFDGGTPPDNSMAISNGGYIVTTSNSTIEYYNTSGSYLYGSSFDDFFNDASLTSMIYDPVVLYDSDSDRFFMVVLHGSSPATSKVLTCFSKTNNPLDGWWVYKLPGDPMENENWFDYPKVGVSDNEVYITGNLFDASDTYDQAVIYQIEKNKGYEGASFNWSYWNNITNTPFTLVPVSFGLQGNYGPGIYLVSTQRSGDNNDKYLFYDLTDDLSGSPQIDAYIIDADFSLAGNALQKGTTINLDNGDNRGLNAFYLNGIIHFVFNSEKINGYNGLNYNRLTLSNLSNWNSIYGLDGIDYSYPSVASFATNENDKSAMICFLASSPSIYPEVRVVSCDNGGNWTGSSLIKAGETFVDVYESEGVTRWGDYTGISRKQNATTPEVWVSGCFGKYRLNENAFDTWVAQINGITVGVTENPDAITNRLNIYPNPVFDIFKVEFVIDKKTNITIELLDVNGRIVKVLYNDAVKEGKNRFSFNKGVLTSGVYFLTIKNNSNTIKYEKVIIE